MALGKCRECGAEVSADAKACPNCGARKPVKRASKILLIILALFVIGALAKLTGQQPISASTQPVTAPTESSNSDLLAQHARETLKIVKQTATLVDFDTIMKSNLSIKNTNSFAVKDMTVICANYAASGTELAATTATIYEILKPGQTRTFRDVDFGFIPRGGKTYNCFVGGAQVATAQR